jgi:hypothetical protein
MRAHIEAPILRGVFTKPARPDRCRSVEISCDLAVATPLARHPYKEYLRMLVMAEEKKTSTAL